MIHKLRREVLPPAMSAGRALLGPVLILGERCNWSGLALASFVVTALLSDIFDGVLARQWHCDTAGVRLLDTLADTFFYLCAAVALWIGQPQLWRENATLLMAVLLAEAANQGFSLAKFGKPASYHSYLAKTWGLVLASAVVAAFATGHSNPLVPAALMLGVASNLEGIAMSLVLSVWHKDVKTLHRAWVLRSSARMPVSVAARTLTTAVFVVVASIGVAPRAFALDPNQAVYVGGSLPIASETAGTLDSSGPTALVFRYKRPDGSADQISIEYAKVTSANPSREVTHHLGVAPAIAAGLLAAREHRYFLTVTWTDPAGLAQVAQMEVRRQEQQPLLAVLHARMPRVVCAACARTAIPPATRP